MCTRGEDGTRWGLTLYITILTDSVRNGLMLEDGEHDGAHTSHYKLILTDSVRNEMM